MIDEDGDRIKQMEKIGRFLHIEGDATDGETLLSARIKTAEGLVTALP